MPGCWSADAAAFVVPASPFDEETIIAAGAASPLEDLAGGVQHVEGAGAVEVGADRFCVERALVVAV